MIDFLGNDRLGQMVMLANNSVIHAFSFGNLVLPGEAVLPDGREHAHEVVVVAEVVVINH